MCSVLKREPYHSQASCLPRERTQIRRKQPGCRQPKWKQFEDRQTQAALSIPHSVIRNAVCTNFVVAVFRPQKWFNKLAFACNLYPCFACIFCAKRQSISPSQIEMKCLDLGRTEAVKKPLQHQRFCSENPLSPDAFILNWPGDVANNRVQFATTTMHIKHGHASSQRALLRQRSSSLELHLYAVKPAYQYITIVRHSSMRMT